MHESAEEWLREYVTEKTHDGQYMEGLVYLRSDEIVRELKLHFRRSEEVKLIKRAGRFQLKPDYQEHRVYIRELDGSERPWRLLIDFKDDGGRG